MAVDDAKRHELSERLAELLGPDLASVLMDNLPPYNWSQLATTADLERLRVELRTELRADLRYDLDAGLASLRTGLRGDMQALRGELRGEMRAQRGELTGEMESLRGEMQSLRGELTGEMQSLRGELRGEMRSMQADLVSTLSDRLTSQTRWTAGSLIATATLLVGASQLGALL